MLFVSLSDCGPSSLLKVIFFAKKIIDVAFIIIPILLIVLMIFDLFKSLTYNGKFKTVKEDDLSELMARGANLAIKRLFNVVILFFVPWMVSTTMGLVSNIGVDYAACLSDVNSDSIAMVENQEIKIAEAEKAAKEIAIQELAITAKELAQRKAIASKMYYASNNSTIKGEGCDGLVYYEEGTFYKPSSSTLNGTEKTKGTGEYFYNKYFLEMLNSYTEAAKEAGYTVEYSTNQYGGWRSLDIQYYFACCDSRNHPEVKIPYVSSAGTCTGSGTCNNGNLAATAGKSNHGWGVASDLSFGNVESRDWAHTNAAKYGLVFSVCADYFGGNCTENWHIEPISLVTDESMVAKCK